MSYSTVLKDTVTVLKFLPNSVIFLNRSSWLNHDIRTCSLPQTENYWIRISLFWGQKWWVIPMTSLIQALEEPVKITSGSFSQEPMDKVEIWLLIRLYIINSSPDIFYFSPKSYRKVRKNTMDWNYPGIIFSGFWNEKLQIFRFLYYSLKYLACYFAFLTFSSHVTKLFGQEKIFL